MRNYFYLSLGMAFTGATVAISKPLAAVMPVFLLGLLRCLIAAIALAPLVLRNPALQFQGIKHAKGALIGQAVTGVFLFTSFLFFGVRHASALSAGIIMATLPAAVAVLSWIWLKERLGRFQAMAVALAILGVATLSLTENGHSAGANALPLLGTGLLVMAVIAEASYTIYAKQTALHLAPLPTAFLVNLLGVGLFAVPGLWQGLTFDWGLVDGRIWSLIFTFAIGSSVFALIFWYMGVKHTPANVAGLFTAVMPLSAGTVAIVFLGETLTRYHIFGALLVISAILLGSLRTRATRSQ